MSDLDLRTAARRAALDGSPEARAALLRERLRCGMDPNLVQLAAHCGDPAARLVESPEELRFTLHTTLGPPTTKPTWAMLDEMWESTGKLPEWLRGLSRWGNEVQVRAAVAAAWECWGGIRRLPLSPHLSEEWAAPIIAMEAVGAWLESPSEERRRSCAALHFGAVGAGLLADGPWRFVLSAVCILGDPRGHAPDALSDCQRAIEVAARLAGEQPVRAAICSSLIAWSLA